MPFVVVYDANVLYPSCVRDLLLRVARAGLVQAKWTDEILDEVFRNIKANRPDLDHARLDRTRTLMNKAIADVLVTGYEPLIEVLDLPDPDDRHVLAAAIKSSAQVIVTENVKHFPPERLKAWTVETQGVDDFVLGLIDLDLPKVYAEVQLMASIWKNPPNCTVEDVLNALEHAGLIESVAALRERGPFRP
ncbi:PIN domain-containing protein [Microlunatus sp. GCM10028923]|uniref:PIN domain-containing protein n=1 Tax=Microlunatus sp. GCM10028923 TaxID=3273400 RepID=UPI003611E813